MSSILSLPEGNIFKHDLEVFERKVTRGIARVAKDVLNEIIIGSPSPSNPNSEYSMGSYVLSHRVSTDGARDPSTTVVTTESSAAKGQARSALTPAVTARNITLGKDVEFSNSISYADTVEYYGWKKTPPYVVYGKAFAVGVAASLDLGGSV